MKHLIIKILIINILVLPQLYQIENLAINLCEAAPNSTVDLSWVQNDQISFPTSSASRNPWTVHTWGKIQTLTLEILNFWYFAQGSGYLEIDIQRIEQLSDKKYFDVSGLKIRKHNKTRKIYGNATLHIDLGNDVLPEIKAYKKSGGEYRLLPYKMPKTPFCEGINGDSYFYPEFAQTSSFPKQPVPCPMPKVWKYLPMKWSRYNKLNRREPTNSMGTILQEQTFQSWSCPLVTMRSNW